LEALRLVASSCWDVIRKQHGQHNWVVELAIPLRFWPVSFLTKQVTFWSLKGACVQLFRRPKGGTQEAYEERFRQVVGDCRHPQFVAYLQSLMNPDEDLPEGILRLRAEMGVPHNHAAVCVVPQGMRTLHLISAFTTPDECYDFLKTVLALRLVALLVQKATVRSLTPADEIVLPPRLKACLRDDERQKMLRAHHPSFGSYDPVLDTGRMSGFTDLAPRRQFALFVLLAGVCLCFHVFSPSSPYVVPTTVSLIAAGLGWLAAVLSLVPAAKQRLILRPALPDLI
jgi:hypothetical protein